MQRLAKALAAVLCTVLIGALIPLGRPVAAAPQVPPGAPPSYRGPAALFDPADPFQGLRWTLGIFLPPRNRVGQARYDLAPRVDYDLDRQIVLLSYEAGNEEVLPPRPLTREEYVGFVFNRQLHKAWIEGNRRVLTETKTGQARGLVNLSLPFQLPFTEKIFGQGAPNLRVTGNESITFSGTSSWVVGQVTGERGGGSLFPKLDMRQRLNVNLQGTIGSKLFIDVSQNSEALTPLENSIKIRYKGEEDDVVKSVELGNTNLALPSSQFVSFSTRQEGLFGIKAEAQVGGLGITAIASRQEGENGQATLVGGAKEQVQRIDDTNFLSGKYFFLSDPDSAAIPSVESRNIRIYLDDGDGNNNGILGDRAANVWIDPRSRTPERPYVGQFHLLQPEDDYVIYNNQNFTQPILVLKNGVSPTQVLATAYVAASLDTVGSFDPAPTDTLQLKMIRPASNTWNTDDLPTSPWGAARRLELKNIYSLGARSIDPTSFELRVERDIGGSNPTDLTNEWGTKTPLIQVLGLDQRNNNDALDFTPDGLVDPEFIDYDQGLVIFPDLRPFDPSVADVSGSDFRARSWPRRSQDCRADTLGWKLESPVACDQQTQFGVAVPSSSAETVPEIYDMRVEQLSTRASQFHLYTMVATFRTAVNTIQLNALGNILEGSETVRLNGDVLLRGTDYTIFYDTGTISLKNPAATAPGADLVVTYSYDSPFSQGSRSLVGGSIATRNDPNSRYSFSTSWLHESRGMPDRRPRLGQEPTKTTVGDLSGQARFTPWAFTEIADKIPFVSTAVPSRLEVNGALGLSFPDPNTRNVVYLDDMEGAEVITSAPVNRFNWFYSSAPTMYKHRTETGLESFTIEPTDRGKLLWFSPNTVRVEDITPGAESRAEKNDLVPVLEMIYVPQSNPSASGSWAGLTTVLSAGGVDVSTAQYLDVWVNDYANYQDGSRPRRGEMFVDIGRVSEDAVWDPLTPPAPPNDALDTEDKNNSGSQLEIDEDLGLDFMADKAEVPHPEKERFTEPGTENSDPAGDNRKRTIETSAPERNLTERLKKYLGINGTESNQAVDSEDLNGNNVLDGKLNNGYREYQIDLAGPALIDLGRDYPSRYTDPANGWRLYRIPLEEYAFDIGADLTAIQHARIWMRGIDPGDTLNVQVAGIEIVGNRWEVSKAVELGADQTFNVSVVNNKENADYVAPVAVRRTNGITEREQSLSFDFQNLRPGQELLAFRPLLDARDYTLYQTIAFYANPRFETIPSDTVEYFVRFGSDASNDSLSYYEVSTRLTQFDPRRREDGWLDFRLDLTDLSNVKLKYPACEPAGEGCFLVGGPEKPREQIGNGLELTIRGNPSFSRVRRVSMGLRNVTDHELSMGSVWMDELRMGDVRRETGYAARASANLVLADLASVSASVSETSADFLRLGQARGTGTGDLAYTVGTQINLNKFVEGARLQAPLRFNYKRGKRTPKFRPNNDVEFVADAGPEVAENWQRDVSISLARDTRGMSPALLRYTLDAVRVNGGLSRSHDTNVTQVSDSKSMSGAATYDFNLGQLGPLRVFRRAELYPWPRTFQVNLSGGKSERTLFTRDLTDPNVLKANPTTSTRTGLLQLTSNIQPIRLLTYTWTSGRDLVDDHFLHDSELVRLQRRPTTVFGINLGRETRQTNTLNFNYTPPFVQAIRPRLNWTGSYSRNADPNLTRADYDSTVVDVSNTSTANLSLTLPLRDLVKKLAGAPASSAGGEAARQRQEDREAERRQRAGKAGAPADSTGAPAAGPPKDAPGARAQIRTLFTRLISLNDIQASATFGKRSAVSGVHGTPPLGYRFGLTRDAGLGQDLFKVSKAPLNDNRGDTQTYRGNTSLGIGKQLTMDFTYQKRLDRSQTNNGLGRIQEETTWPDVRFNWNDIQKKLPLVNKIFTDFRTASTNYSRTTVDAGNESNPKESVTTTINWRPLVSVNGTIRGDWRTSMGLDKSSSQTVNRQAGGSAFTTDRSSLTYRLTLAKRFLRKSKGGQARDIDLNIDANYTRQDQVTRMSSGLTPSQPQKTDNLQLRVGGTFRMTSTITGTLGVNLGQQRNLVADYTRRSIGISFTSGFSF
jgi:cell surface protein SprA